MISVPADTAGNTILPEVIPMSVLGITLILSAVSGLLMGLGCLVRRLERLCGVVTLVWLAAAVPIMYFLSLPSENVLLFFLISAVLSLVFQFGGKRT